MHLQPSLLLLPFLTALVVPLSAAQNTTTADPAIQAAFPPCAQTCIAAALAPSGCTATDQSCICQNQTFLNSVQQCETSTCSASDQQKIYTLSRQLCAPVGGFVFVNASTTITSDTSTTGAAPAVFTGAAVAMRGGGGWAVAAVPLVGALTLFLLSVGL